MYEIDIIAHVLKGLKDSEEGRTITSEELIKRIEKWSKKKWTEMASGGFGGGRSGGGGFGGKW
jgi:hypothetical protein